MTQTNPNHMPTESDFLRAQSAYLHATRYRRLLSTAWSELTEHGPKIVKAFLCGLLLMGVTAVALHRGWAAEGRWVMVEATAYCPCSLCCEGSADGITASGARTSDRPYGVAASRSIALGSIIRVPVGYGYLDQTRATERDFQVDDRGAALDSEYTDGRIPRLDLRYKNHWSAKQFGRKLMVVYIAPPL